MDNTLQDKAVVLVGYGGIARAVTLLARSEGARVVVAVRDKAKLVAAYNVPDITAEVVEAAPIAVRADRVVPVDHILSTASARARLPPAPTGWAPPITWCRPPRPAPQES
jgi:shikimate 5-dehydrogenase